MYMKVGRYAMPRLEAIALLCGLALMLTFLPVHAGESTSPSSADALTNYLHQNRLPLVQAQILPDEDGNHQVIIYGFVATAFGKTDAADKARAFLKDPNIKIVNRVKVRPEIANQNPSAEPAGAKTSPDDSALPPDSPGDEQAYRNQQLADQPQHGQQNSAMQTMPLGLGALLGGFGNLGNGTGSGFGSSYNTPYQSYSPYPSPPAYPYYGPYSSPGYPMPGSGFGYGGPGLGYPGAGPGFGYGPYLPHR